MPDFSGRFVLAIATLNTHFKMRSLILVLLVFYTSRTRGVQCTCNTSVFPDSFKFGAGTSAYQIEGGWNEDGKGRSVWDFFQNTYPQYNSYTTGNVAADSYHRYKEDVAAMQEIGLDYYRFSLSWSRILPKGLRYSVNQAGVDYYNNLLDELVAAGIEPMVTIFHWDTPLALEYFGYDWTNPKMVEYFVDYADLVFSLFGDRVKLWATINEPKSFCQAVPDALVRVFPEMPVGTLEYLCAHHTLLAHAKTYRLYQQKYKATQKGRLSMTIDYNWNEPRTDSAEDLAAVERKNAFEIGWYAHPLVFGDYPQIMKDVIAANSLKQNFSKSRLPEFTQQEKAILRGSIDFFSLNQYTAYYVNSSTYNNVPNYSNDVQVNEYQSDEWPLTAISYMRVVPWGLQKTLAYIKNTYRNPEIMITENGYNDATGTLTDTNRINAIGATLQAVRLAMCEDNVRVTRYTYWSLLDNLEWNRGYTVKFGLVHVDYENETLNRTLKDSAYYYKNLISSRLINANVS